MQNFKESPYQNYIQLRFTNRPITNCDFADLHLNYKRNISILSKIFSFQTLPPAQSPSSPSSPLKQDPVLTRELVDKIHQQVQEEERQANERISKSMEMREKFEEIANDTVKISTKEEFEEMVRKLKEGGMYDETHPYLVESSPFYMNLTGEQVLEVVSKEQQEKSWAVEQELLFEELN